MRVILMLKIAVDNFIFGGNWKFAVKNCEGGITVF
jgi:hypothetical protein